MTASKKVRLVLTFAMVASIVSILWVCSAGKIGLQDPSSITISEIVAGLANARTQVEAEVALENLLDKTGVGREIKGSRYVDYFLGDGSVSDLAKSHLLFLNDDYAALTWGDTYELEQLFVNEERFSAVDFASAVARLQQQANTALVNSESPENALLIALVADGAGIPATIPLYMESDIISPLQNFLFNVWLAYEYQSDQSIHKKILSPHFPRNISFNTIRTLSCPSKRRIKKEFFFTVECQEQLDCMRAAYVVYRMTALVCIDNRNSCGIQRLCLQQALADLEAVWDACLLDPCPHDQGGGN